MGVLEITNLSKVYGCSENSVKALDGINLSVEDGELVAIVGKSGSGKSTLLHIIAGIDTPTNGEIFVNNKCLNQMNKDQLAEFRRKDVGIIYQFYNLVPVLNVEENIVFPSMLGKEKIDKDRLDELLKAIDMEERRKHFPNQLSGGQQQRVAVGRVIYTNPSIILADEPTGNLDSKTGSEVVKCIVDLNRKYGKTVLIVTHDMQLANVANRIITISDGKIVKDIINENNI